MAEPCKHHSVHFAASYLGLATKSEGFLSPGVERRRDARDYREFVYIPLISVTGKSDFLEVLIRDVSGHTPSSVNVNPSAGRDTV